MEVVVIRYIYKDDHIEEIAGVAINMDVAKEYAKELKNKYPCYNERYGRFFFEEHKVMEESRRLL